MTKAEAIEMCALATARREHQVARKLASDLALLFDVSGNAGMSEERAQEIQGHLRLAECFAKSWEECRRALEDPEVDEHPKG